MSNDFSMTPSSSHSDQLLDKDDEMLLNATLSKELEFDFDAQSSGESELPSEPQNITTISFDCKGEVNRHNPNLDPEGYVISGEVISFCTSNLHIPFPWEGKNVILFGHVFDAGSALLWNTDLLFKLAKQEMLSLETGALGTIGVTPFMPAPVQVCKADFRALRMNVCEFLMYARNFLHSSLMNEIDSGWWKEEGLPSMMNWMKALRLQAGSLENLPEHVVAMPANQQGNKCQSASYHLFHLHLDIRWSYLVMLFELNKVRCQLGQEDPETQDLFFVDSVRRSHEKFNEATLSCISELVFMAVERFRRVTQPMNLVKRSPFSCTCVKEFWIMLRILLDNSEGQSFWSCLHEILGIIMGEKEETKESPPLCNAIQLPSNFLCTNPLQFSWWLLHHLAFLYGYSERGEWMLDSLSTSKTDLRPNYPELEGLLRKVLEKEASEAQVRMYLPSLMSLTKAWGPRVETLLILWGYFRPKLNSAFSVSGTEAVKSLPILSISGKQWLEAIQNRMRSDYQEQEEDTSFILFLRILSFQVLEFCKRGQTREWRQVKGRILADFHPGKIKSLSERGLHHFATLFLTLASVTDMNDLSSKLLDFLNYVPSSKDINYHKLVWKVQVALILLHVEKNQDITLVAKNLVSSLSAICSEFSSQNTLPNRKRELASLVAIFLEGLRDLAQGHSQLDHSEWTLIVPSIGQFLTTCKSGELSSALDCLLIVLDKFQQVSCDAGLTLGQGHNQHQNLIRACMNHLLPAIKTLSCNSCFTTVNAISMQIAKMASALTLLSFRLQGDQSSKDSLQALFEFFCLNENVNVEVSLSFLATCLLREDSFNDGDGGVVLATLALQNDQYQTTVIQAWLRCLLLTSNLICGNVWRLTGIVAKLPDMLQISTASGIHFDQDRNNPLFEFFRLLGCAYDQLTDFPTKMKFKQTVLQYLGLLDKCVSAVTRTWEPQELVHRLFVCFGALLQYCAPLIYVKSKPDCLLVTMMNQLVLPHAVYKALKEPLHPNFIDAAKEALPQIIMGLSRLNYQRDTYLSRCLKDVVVQYLPLFPTRSSSHPLLMCFVETCSTELEGFLLDAIKSSYLSTASRANAGQQTLQALHLLLEVLSGTGSENTKKEVGKVIFSSLLDHLMSTENAGFKGEATKILEQTLRILENSQLRWIIKERVIFFVNSQLAFNSLKVFRLLQGLAMLNKSSIVEVFPQIKDAVISVENRRGSGQDRSLREGLEKLQLQLKIIG